MVMHIIIVYVTAVFSYAHIYSDLQMRDAMEGKLFSESIMIMPRMLSLILGIMSAALLVFAIYEIYAGGDFSPGSTAGIILISTAAIMIILCVALSFLRLKITVEYDSLTVGLLKGRSIPMNDIHSVISEDFSPMKDYFGWGVKVGRKGLGYIASGTKNGLRINLKTGKSFFISSKRTFEFESAVNMALKSQKNDKRDR